ncbi:hypothetical protein Anas_06403 [Armadillidium nasatum]|uniref:C2H2-type domain-containing protein n=1 Tax=Armadillidium nasatum TaxID=96803 RepID=A0A5N5TNH9_9CRUS|nr:hypothetical protein Anas_06403 [Armadillidium nasatum]
MEEKCEVELKTEVFDFGEEEITLTEPPEQDSSLKERETLFDCNNEISIPDDIKKEVLQTGTESVPKKSLRKSAENLIVSKKKVEKMEKNQKKFKCSFGHISTYRNWDNKNQLLVQPGKKLFRCPNCDYSCSGKGSLTKHMVKHSHKLNYLSVLNVITHVFKKVI